jgi:hypothetical protein
MEQKFNWACIRDSKNYIEVYDERPAFMPAHETLVKDVEVITNSNGTIFISGQEIVFHLLVDGTPVSKLDFTPAEHEIKRYREGLFRKRFVDYVKSGWVEDKETKKYEAKFCGYAIRFYTAGGVQTQ